MFPMKRSFSVFFVAKNHRSRTLFSGGCLVPRKEVIVCGEVCPFYEVSAIIEENALFFLMRLRVQSIRGTIVCLV